MNLEPYVPAITAALTLINTIVLVWNQRHFATMKHRFNSLISHTLADAERRGRASAARQLGADPAEVDATFSRRGSDHRPR